MVDWILTLPLLCVSVMALLALLYGSPAVNRRLSITQVSWLLALAPLSAFGLILALLAGGREPIIWQVTWLPALDWSLGLYFDSWSGLFGLLVSGIGTLVTIYTGYYFKGDNSAWRFLVYMALFMFSMLGLVFAGDVITLFVFWEGTSITSFLLVAYKTKDEAARRGAFQALFITGGGGIALLAGLLILSSVAGSTTWLGILGQGDLLRASALYPVMLGLIAFGAMTKSAQAPAHIWLPNAMSAPTPASAYLHSATMVKAGIYLMARLNPALGFTDTWFYLLSAVGLITMLTGAYLGVKQNDLKALLAYSTIAQLGVLMMLIGQDTDIAYKALVIGVLAHALYKSALFLVAGIVDHETGTRDMRRLGGLARAMPITFVIAFVASLSLAGLPPLFGFLAKETLLATATHPNVPSQVNFLFPAATVVAGALLLVQAGLFCYETFLGKRKDPTIQGHEPPWGMWLAPLLPAFYSLALGLLPEPRPVGVLLADAATAVYGDKVKVSLALWTGINVPLLLSIVAVSLGSLLFLLRHRLRQWQNWISEGLTFNRVYEGVLTLLYGGGRLATRLQNGQLRIYLAVIFAGTGLLLIVWNGQLPLPSWPQVMRVPAINFSGELALLRIVTLLFAIFSAVATVVLRRGFYAVLALSISGLAVAILMALEPAPDVALVQVVVDILAVVILVLAMTRMPRPRRMQAWQQSLKVSPGLVRDAVVAIAGGLVVMWMTLLALDSRPHPSPLTEFYAANAKKLTGATDIVGAIIVDYRVFDTLIEIAVFGMAGLGVYALLRYASLKAGDRSPDLPKLVTRVLPTSGISGPGMSLQPSAFIRLIVLWILPLSMVLALTQMMYGHDQPGDGFTAGVIIGLALGSWYVVFGYEATKQRLRWLRPVPLIALGLLLFIGNGLLTAVFNDAVLSHVEYDKLVGLPLPAGFHISSAFLTEVAICLTVLGSAVFMLDALGHPGDPVSDD